MPRVVIWLKSGLRQWAGRRLPVFLVGMARTAYICVMANQGPVIDMTPDGHFVEPAKPTIGLIVGRLVAFAMLLLMAAVAFWMALFIVPVLIILALAGYAVARSQARRRPLGW
jgi:uncharacterized membrane protein